MIRAVIGIKHEEGSARAYYVLRSDQMTNYPNVWSLLSEKFTEEELPDHLDLSAVQLVFNRMAIQRLGGTPVRVTHYITSGTCDKNPMNKRVTLHLYRIEFEDNPELNPRYYIDSEWLDAEVYHARADEAACGLCTRLWSDHCVRMGWVDEPFAHPNPLDL